MFFPFRIGSSIDWESKKSFPHPSVGQIATAAFGVPQNFEITSACCTCRKFSLKPSFLICSANACPVFEAGSWLSEITSRGGPLYRPVLEPAFFIYDFARLRSPLGFARKS